MSDGTQADLSKAQILYSSDDEQIASVDDNGVVHGVGEDSYNHSDCKAERYYSPK